MFIHFIRKSGERRMQFGGRTNNTEIEADGTLTFNGAAVVWDDLRVPLTSGRPGASNPPDFEAFSGTIFQFAFDDEGVNEDEIYFSAQLPHSYKQGTDILPHLHWAPQENPADASHDVVRWGFEYEWQSIGSAFAGTTTVYVDGEMGATDIKGHIYTPFSAMTGTGKTISSMIIGRLFRNSTHANDTYDSKKAFALEFDFHFQLNMVGSREALAK